MKTGRHAWLSARLRLRLPCVPPGLHALSGRIALSETKPKHRRDTAPRTEMLSRLSRSAADLPADARVRSVRRRGEEGEHARRPRESYRRAQRVIPRARVGPAGAPTALQRSAGTGVPDVAVRHGDPGRPRPRTPRARASIHRPPM